MEGMQKFSDKSNKQNPIVHKKEICLLQDCKYGSTLGNQLLGFTKLIVTFERKPISNP